MNVLIFSLIVAALILGPLGIIIFLINLIKHKSKKVPLVLVSLSIAFIVFSVAWALITEPEGGYPEIGVNTPTYSNNSVTTQNPNAMTDTEIFAAEFCMAYMNHLKNPYSFTVHSVWGYDEGNGRYQTYVKFTAENGFGASVVDQIGTMSSLNYSELDVLASNSDYVNIYTWGGEPAYKIAGRGEILDADKIQNYINNNYN